ncbi:P pilus assembly chaperone PapD [Novosphingobium hassiacum]|uniref:P pilus assembly chaperone PapD n=1 Tax=Novosphingobium hassiacum TaxID=173676 RepID=A0A7W5ZSE5_9SPHN|nr:fimbria/pilus periplasmic chaperone [Novosphingobium hassiacum]MBB3859131.1 P pilus assembly chaperone PapD [Novosphingobium hassiacum]
MRRTLGFLATVLVATSAMTPAAAQQTSLPITQPKADGATTQTIAPISAAANINLTPRRVIFDRTKRTEAVYVFNQGNTPVTVDVALVDNAMLPSGEIVPMSRIAERDAAAQATAAKVQSAKPFLLAAPSRMTLPPGQGKTIRVRATLADGAQASEYRSHLTVTTVPSPDSGLTAEQAAASEKGELVLRIQSIFGISIPLIVRGGVADATGSMGPISQVTLPEGPALAVTLRRQGTTSLYGNIELRTAKEVVGVVRGIAVYPEVGERVAQVPLLRPLKKGEIVTATYIADGAGKASPIASGTYTAP